MKIPQYVTATEVKKVCQDLGISDWTNLNHPDVSEQEAKTILDIINVKNMDIDLKDFQLGLEVEFEHGIQFEDANVTNNHPILTGMIVLAHMKETLDYYQRLDVAECEGDLMKAVLSGNTAKIQSKFKELVKAQAELNKVLSDQINRG